MRTIFLAYKVMYKGKHFRLVLAAACARGQPFQREALRLLWLELFGSPKTHIFQPRLTPFLQAI